ncbi:MAG: ribosome maturation factor RimM [Bacteroidota bacterium]
MTKDDCFYLGKIVSKYSFNGEVLIKLDTDEPHSYENTESILIELGSKLIPFFIEKSSLHKSSLLRARIEDVVTEQDADELISASVYLPLSQLPKLEENQFYYHEIIGFSAVDNSYGKIGVIKGVNDNTPQALFEIEFEGKEVLIPVNDQFISKIDKAQKVFYFNTPPGLIEMYLGDS